MKSGSLPFGTLCFVLICTFGKGHYRLDCPKFRLCLSFSRACREWSLHWRTFSVTCSVRRLVLGRWFRFQTSATPRLAHSFLRWVVQAKVNWHNATTHQWVQAVKYSTFSRAVFSMSSINTMYTKYMHCSLPPCLKSSFIPQKAFPENFDLYKLPEKTANLFNSMKAIATHTVSCLSSPKGFQLGLTQLSDFVSFIL